MKIDTELSNLLTYIERNDYKGWDPFDGLNSKILKFTRLNKFRIVRLAWIQFFKLFPLNIRKIFLVDKGYNSKGIALILNGYCSLYRSKRYKELGLNKKLILSKIIQTANLLLSIKNNNFSGDCWGYNFDWQNRVFFQPYNTPTIVATSFCADALFDAYEITKNTKYLDSALSTCEFILNDLNRTYLNSKNFIFSYSPNDSSQVYNASLLGSKTLARSSYYTKDTEKSQSLIDFALNSTLTIINKQNSDGSWKYGESKYQNWIDSFHTGFNLECIHQIMNFTNNTSFSESFHKGMEYYKENFISKKGEPKYFNNKTFPIDIHSPSQLMLLLLKLVI